MSILRTRVVCLIAALLLLTACAREAQPKQVDPTLADLRQRVSAAFDGTASSAARRAAADDSVRLLLSLLQRPESYEITDEEWSASPRPGVEVMVRHVDLGSGVHLYALALPGRSLVDEADRVVVQVRGGSMPLAYELTPLPLGRLDAARVYSEPGGQLITLTLREGERTGFVAQFSGPGSGPFALVSDAFAGMEGTYGTAQLKLEEGILRVTIADGQWAPAFDDRERGTLVLAPEVYLKWDGRFKLVDESRFDAVTLMSMATDPAKWCRQEGDCPQAVFEALSVSPKQAAEIAWQLATAKLTRTLAAEGGWSDGLALRLPDGSRILEDEGRALSARLLTVPAPEPLKGLAYTAVQFRTGGGIPLTRVLDLPGPVESVRVTAHHGNPALLLVVDETADREAGTVESRGVHLLLLDAGNDWQPASDWVGFLPEAPLWNIASVSPHAVTISWDRDQMPDFSVALEAGEEPQVAVCQRPGDCHYLTWVDGTLNSLPILTYYVAELTRPHTPGELEWYAGQVAEFLRRVDPASPTANRLRQLIDPDGRYGVSVIEAGDNTRLVSLPPNPAGTHLAILHYPGQAQLVATYDGVVSRWEAAQIVQAGQERRLLLLGRSDVAATLLAFNWQYGVWAPADPLEEEVNRIMVLSLRVMHTPGAERPARGLIVLGGQTMRASLSSTGASFCEGVMGCINYRYDGGWRLD